MANLKKNSYSFIIVILTSRKIKNVKKIFIIDKLWIHSTVFNSNLEKKKFVRIRASIQITDWKKYSLN